MRRGLITALALLLCASEATAQIYTGFHWRGVPINRTAAGTVAGGVNAITPGLPTDVAFGDLLIYMLETKGDQAVDTDSAVWTEATSSPSIDASTTISRLTVFWAVYTEGLTALSTDSGNHQAGRVIALKAGTFNPINPINAAAASTNAAGTTFTATGVTTSRPDCLVVVMVGANGPDAQGTGEFNTVANSNLLSITELVNDTRTNATGTGSGLGLWVGRKKAPGATGDTTGNSTNSTTKTNLVLAINPP